MNWTQFLSGVAVCYALYYGLNLLYDLFRARGERRDSGQAEELVIANETAPVSVGVPPQGGAPADEGTTMEPTARTALSSGPLQSTGGVDIRQLFALAQADVIQYTKAIPY
jgi:hypothetical protein